MHDRVDLVRVTHSAAVPLDRLGAQLRQRQAADHAGTTTITSAAANAVADAVATIIAEATRMRARVASRTSEKGLAVRVMKERPTVGVTLGQLLSVQHGRPDLLWLTIYGKWPGHDALRGLKTPSRTTQSAADVADIVERNREAEAQLHRRRRAAGGPSATDNQALALRRWLSSSLYPAAPGCSPARARSRCATAVESGRASRASGARNTHRARFRCSWSVNAPRTGHCSGGLFMMGQPAGGGSQTEVAKPGQPPLTSCPDVPGGSVRSLPGWAATRPSVLSGGREVGRR